MLDAIAKQAAAVSRLRSGTQSLLIAQRISVTFQKENARAVMRRRSDCQERNAPHLAERPAVSQPLLWDFIAEPIVPLITAAPDAVMAARDIRLNRTQDDDGEDL